MALLLGASGTAPVGWRSRAGHRMPAPHRARPQRAQRNLASNAADPRPRQTMPGTHSTGPTRARQGEPTNPGERARPAPTSASPSRHGPHKSCSRRRTRVQDKLIPDTDHHHLEVRSAAIRATAAAARSPARARHLWRDRPRRSTSSPCPAAPPMPAFAGRTGKPAVVESFGLAGFGYHARDEYIETGSIVPRLYLMTRILTWSWGSGRKGRQDWPAFQSNLNVAARSARGCRRCPRTRRSSPAHRDRRLGEIDPQF